MTVYYVLLSYWAVCAICQAVICHELQAHDDIDPYVKRRSWWKEAMVSPVTLPAMLMVNTPEMMERKQEIEKKLLYYIDTLTQEDSTISG